MTKYFAKLDEFNTVIKITTVKDEIAPTEEAGVAYLTNLTQHANWKQTDKLSRFRKNGASEGFTFDAAKDAFIQPQPYPSWTLNETTCLWDPPIPYPDPLAGCKWDEESRSWVMPSQ